MIDLRLITILPLQPVQAVGDEVFVHYRYLFLNLYFRTCAYLFTFARYEGNSRIKLNS